jgi:quercetin dioxygenase-like cupin family protein
VVAEPTPPQLDIDAVVACTELEPVLDRLHDLGFVLHMVMPADDPALAVLEGGGLTLRLVRGEVDAGALATTPLLPPLDPVFELTHLAETGWGPGRAGMLYRDLLPARQGGRFIASHIRIPEAGPVPDTVHYHRVRFQVICCVAGWARLVYEDHGPPFVLTAGDCVLQPPGIRHRVLESSDGLEVVEVTSPAVHETWFDHDLTLPNAVRDTTSDGQRFVHHRGADATWAPWRGSGFECSDSGIGAATDGLAGVRTVRGDRGAVAARFAHSGELQLWFVRDGAATLTIEGEPAEQILRAGDAVAVPAGLAHSLVAATDGVELLEVTLPDELGPAP